MCINRLLETGLQLQKPIPMRCCPHFFDLRCLRLGPGRVGGRRQARRENQEECCRDAFFFVVFFLAFTMQRRLTFCCKRSPEQRGMLYLAKQDEDGQMKWLHKVLIELKQQRGPSSSRS